MPIKDNFSRQSQLYAQYRPHYPPELYQFVYEHVHSFGAAWDCATGNGQVARELCHSFKQVYASDISEKQLSQAHQAKNIRYIKAPAHQMTLPHNTIDLTTVAQALHWLNTDKFYQEVQRVSRHQATLAYWGYGLLRVNAKIDPLIREFHDQVLGAYWDPERRILLNEYDDISFPLVYQQKKRFIYRLKWDLHHLYGYLNSWSAVQRYIQHHHENPVDIFAKKLQHTWEASEVITFPISLTIGQIG